MDPHTSADGSRTFELFHDLIDPESAEVRRKVVDLGLKARIDFLNLAFPGARERLRALGGSRLPALWDGAALHEGAAAILLRISAL